MNGKKSKLMRRAGKLDKSSKKLYNTLNHREKGVLGEVYTKILNTSSEDDTPKIRGQIPQIGN